MRATGQLLHRKDTARNWLQRYSGSRRCPVRSSTCREEIGRCVPSPCRARQADGVPRSSSRQKRKLIPPTLPHHNKPRWRKPRACARFGWPRKQPTRRLQSATRRQRRPLDLRRADTFRGTSGLAQNPSRGLVAASSRMLSRASFCLTPSQIAEVKRLHKTGSRRRRPTAARSARLLAAARRAMVEWARVRFVRTRLQEPLPHRTSANSWSTLHSWVMPRNLLCPLLANDAVSPFS
jgi:hypothetical protein